MTMKNAQSLATVPEPQTLQPMQMIQIAFQKALESGGADALAVADRILEQMAKQRDKWRVHGGRMKTELATIEQPAQIDRRTFIGSSDIAAIIGISPWKTPYELWEEKTASEPEVLDTPILRRGRRAEPFLIETLKSEFDVWVGAANVRSQHAEYPFMWAESDFTYVASMNGDESANMGHGEIKSVGFNRGEWGEAGSQDVPPYYLAQVMFALQVNKLPEATIWGCFGFDDIRPYRFEYDAETGEALEAAAVAFWQNHVIPRIAPPTKTAEDCRRMLSRFNGFTWEANEEALSSAARLQAMKRTLKITKDAIDAEEKVFLDCVVSAAQIYGVETSETKNISVLAPGGAKFATYNLIERKGYTVAPTSFRMLRFAGKKDAE